MTAPDRATGADIARRLVEERLAACGNLVPGLESVFRWQGSVTVESEVLMILKTTVERLDPLMARAVELHPYDVPEVLAMPVTEAWGPYETWVITETTKGSEP